jgi:amino acid transporter
LLIIILGFMRAAGYTFGGHANPATHPTHNFELDKSFKGDGQNAPSFADSLLFIVYTFSGFEQPFYVLSEVRAPRRRFPKCTLTAMLIATLLFLLVNIAYVSHIPHSYAHSQGLQSG